MDLRSIDDYSRHKKMRMPTELNGWSYELIEKLVHEGYLETDQFDFKGELNSKDPKHAENLTKISCAFANTVGGFIVFGIADLDQASRIPRIFGITLHAGLAKEFGEKIRGASPNILFDFRNPPIQVPASTKVLFLVHIGQSPDRPHMTADGKFWKRTNEGNKLMSYEEIRESFLHYEERRHKIKHLYLELVEIRQMANIVIEVPDPTQQYPLAPIETTSLNALLVDTYSMLQNDPTLIANLFKIRRIASVINYRIQAFHAAVPLMLTINSTRQAIRQLNRDLERNAKSILMWTDQCIKTLETKYGLTNPPNTSDLSS